MLQDRIILEKFLETQAAQVIINQEQCKELYNYINETYKIPRGLTSDLIAFRKSLSEVSEFILFCLLDGFNTVQKKVSTLDKYFTIQEVQTYQKSQYQIEKIKFPLIFPMIQITDNQWIGKITVSQLMELRKAQLINYNVNAQRTMQRVIRGSKEVFKISLNWNAIRQIVASLQSRQYIPNTLTLNIPEEDTGNDFYYDDNKSFLVINSLKFFDMTDGYHRYISACQIRDQDETFDYDMELRIVHFPESKAQQFIYQEDQKTKMSKVDSNSLNTTKAANIVVTRINEDPKCNLQGLISRNDGLISFGELAEIIDYLYFKNVRSKEKEKIEIIKVTKKIVNNLNILTEYDTKYLESKYSFLKLAIIMYCFAEYADKDANQICKIIDYVIQQSDKIDKKKFYTKQMRQSLINAIDNIAKECEI